VTLLHDGERSPDVLPEETLLLVPAGAATETALAGQDGRALQPCYGGWGWMPPDNERGEPTFAAYSTSAPDAAWVCE
jgi:hypothetical protein